MHSVGELVSYPVMSLANHGDIWCALLWDPKVRHHLPFIDRYKSYVRDTVSSGNIHHIESSGNLGEICMDGVLLISSNRKAASTAASQTSTS